MKGIPVQAQGRKGLSTCEREGGGVGEHPSHYGSFDEMIAMQLYNITLKSGELTRHQENCLS